MSNTEISALKTQVGGSHYKSFAIQPMEFIFKNNLGYLEGNVIKYICRYKFKDGVKDIDKAIHYLQTLKELQYAPPTPVDKPSDTK